jgi:hypothetical protein
MTRTAAVFVLFAFAAAGTAGDAYAGKFNNQVNGNFTHSNNNTVTFTMPPVVCVPHGHHQCPNPPGSTIPDCHGGHMGPNGVMIQCK